jgi:Glu-tRNA(Gln) amidotransferase subunit E-like FAD-binding protein
MKCDVDESHITDEQGCVDCLTNETLKELGNEELYKIIIDTVDKNIEIVMYQKERAIGTLMNIVMKQLRGKIDGEYTNRILLDIIRNRIR